MNLTQNSQSNTQDTTPPNPQLVMDLTKAIAYTENGGKPTNSKSGKTGEMKSIFQYTPGTWKQYSKEETGQDNLKLTPETETFVTSKKIYNWLKQGKTIPQIASMWNAGEGEPDAFSGKFSDGSSSTGTNKKFNVKFDVPDYVGKVLSYMNQFTGQSTQNSSISEGQLATSQGNTGMMNQNTPPFTLSRKTNKGLISPQIKES